jgi:hypothetical protein
VAELFSSDARICQVVDNLTAKPADTIPETRRHNGSTALAVTRAADSKKSVLACCDSDAYVRDSLHHGLIAAVTNTQCVGRTLSYAVIIAPNHIHTCPGALGAGPSGTS